MEFFNHKFTNLSQLQSNTLSNPQTLNPSLYNNNNFKQNITATKAQQDFPQISSRSLKTCADPFQSSFQLNCLHQHYVSLQKQLEKPIEILNKILNKNQIKIKKQQNQSMIYTIKEFMNVYCNQISKQQQKQFSSDLIYEKKLSDFLTHIQQTYTHQISAQLLTTANFIWQLYTQVSSQRFRLTQLKQWAQKSSIQHYDACKRFLKSINNQLDYIQNQDDKNIIQNQIKDFIKYFFLTVALVIQQYFQNPYFSQQSQVQTSAKRSHSEDDFYSQDQGSQQQSQSSIYGKKMGNKKIKFW